MSLDHKAGNNAREAVATLCLALWPRLESTIRPAVWYRAGIRFALRIVAVRFAESRDLLPMWSPVYREAYSIGGLWQHLRAAREQDAEMLRTGYGAWPRLLTLFRLIHRGCSHPEIPVRAYGGELFEEGSWDAADPVTRALSRFDDPSAPVSDHIVASVLDRLLTDGRQRALDFAGLDPDYVGLLYQAFLDGRMTLDGGRPRIESDRRDRKSQGTFYTPRELAEVTVEKTLLPACTTGDVLAPPEELLSLRILDPAMGSGAFLVAALRVLTRRLAESLRQYERLESRARSTLVHWGTGRSVEIPHPMESSEFEASLMAHIRRQLVEDCLHGVDSDATSVLLARFSLWLETMDRSLPLTFLAHKLKVGNSLIGATIDELAVYPLAAWRAWQGPNGCCWREQVAEQLASVASARQFPPLPFAQDRSDALRIRKTLAHKLTQLHRLPIRLPDAKRRFYEEEVLRAQARKGLKAALDSWCALWFWPDAVSAQGTGPADWYAGQLPPETTVSSVALRHRFFHWELEFPVVFARRRPGFDVIIGNPPWDVLKGAPKMANWIARRHRAGGRFHRTLALDRASAPFVAQGSGDTNTYKLFVEQCMALLRTKGRLGLILPAGIYADAGSGELRRLLAMQGQWEWLFGMTNRRRLFPIDGRFRFAAIVVQKGGRTSSIKASFFNSTVAGWEEPSAAQWGEIALPAHRAVAALPPFAEVAAKAAQRAHGKIDSLTGRVLTRHRGSYRASYRREIDAGGRNRLFHPASHWPEASPDELGLLRLKGGQLQAIPVIQGAMISQFIFPAAQWNGSHGSWRPSTAKGCPPVHPRYFMSPTEALGRVAAGPRIAIRRITNATNTRTVVASLVPPLPCVDKAAVLHDMPAERALLLLGVLNALSTDAASRLRCAGTQLDRHHLDSLPLPDEGALERRTLALLTLRLAGPHPWFAPLWLALQQGLPSLSRHPWGAHYLWSEAPRRKARAAIDALVAYASGLDSHDFQALIADCHHSTEALRHRRITRALDPRGFWRIDSALAPEERQPALALAYLKELLADGPQALLDQVGFDVAAPTHLSWEKCSGYATAVDELSLDLSPPRKMTGLL